MILKFIKNIFKKGTVTFFNATNYELKNFFCGYGICTIKKDEISIKNYPFKPSLANPSIILKADEINSITLTATPPQLSYKNDWIFISAEKLEELTKFVETNNIKISEKNWTWDNILDPFLDTEYTEEETENTINSLIKNGISRDIVIDIRKEVSEQMYKYNFDTMLWEWVSLGLSDVLQAMRVKYSDKEFQVFYNKAMAIENMNVKQ
ncbi:hypothetical protein [Aquimarina pacifica]|uniref:hypothetical protein n=1 Tax=Aquimarina pacifica TaxID=1296415 RepID=UPI000472672D|nr:hypothetical protein [Aquimarina pacifica]